MNTELVDRLCHFSTAKPFLPETSVPWELARAGDDFTIPAELLSIHGMPQLSRLSAEARRRLMRHEIAALFSFAIRLENVLIRNMSERIRRGDPLNPAFKYYLHAIEEECRHNRMFLRMIAILEVGSYPSSGVRGLAESLLGQLTRWDALFLLMTLASEELPDVMFAKLRDAPEAHPVLRAIGLVHRIEEARHISFGRDHFLDLFAAAGPIERAFIRHVSPYVVGAIFDGFVSHDVFLRSGICRTRIGAWWLWLRVRTSPHRRALRREAAARLTRFLEATGVIDDRTRSHWVRNGLMSRTDAVSSPENP